MSACAQCGKDLRDNPDNPKSDRSWCSDACIDAYYAAHPEEAAGWVKVADLTPPQKAELQALLGKGVKC